MFVPTLTTIANNETASFFLFFPSLSGTPVGFNALVKMWSFLRILLAMKLVIALGPTMQYFRSNGFD